MRKNFMKKVVAGMLTAVMAFSLTACGGGDASTNDTAKEEGSSDVITVGFSQVGAESDSSSSSDDVITVGFSQVGAESDWRTANSESMKSTFTKDNGYELIFDDAQQKQENQISAIRNFIQQDVDYIVLAPVTETGWDAVLGEAKQAGIPVIIVDRMVDVKDDSLYTAWVGSNFELEGKKAAAYLDAYMKAKNMKDMKLVNIQGTIGASAQIGRTKGLDDAVAANGWNLLDKTTGEFTQAKGQEVMESFLKQNKDIDVVVAQNDNMAFGAIDAIEAAGKTVGSDIANGEIMVISFDTTHAGLQDVLDGKIECDVECNPLHGPRAEELIKKLEAGEDIDKLNYVDEEIFAHDDTVKSVKATNSLDEEKDFDVTPLTQDILDKRAY